MACYDASMRPPCLIPTLLLALAAAGPAAAGPADAAAPAAAAPILVPAAPFAAAPPVAVPLLPPLPAPLDEVSREVEVLRLRESLRREVPNLVLRSAAGDAGWIALARAEAATAGFVPDRPQLLVVVDRNPRVQGLAVVMAVPDGAWKVVGATRVSTGSVGRFDHYVTPRGVFRVTDAILGFRAEGTLNGNGIRGLGVKGMRVWDFGWQRARKGWTESVGKPDSTPIRLMMHATDPDKLEQRIGQPASQGCIRIPTALNRFLDRHGVLDAEYERVAVTDIRFRTLLPPGRVPSSLAGNTLVVVDSAARPGSVDKLGDVVMAGGK